MFGWRRRARLAEAEAARWRAMRIRVELARAGPLLDIDLEQAELIGLYADTASYVADSPYDLVAGDDVLRIYLGGRRLL